MPIRQSPLSDCDDDAEIARYLTALVRVLETVGRRDRPDDVGRPDYLAHLPVCGARGAHYDAETGEVVKERKRQKGQTGNADRQTACETPGCPWYGCGGPPASDQRVQLYRCIQDCFDRGVAVGQCALHMPHGTGPQRAGWADVKVKQPNGKWKRERIWCEASELRARWFMSELKKWVERPAMQAFAPDCFVALHHHIDDDDRYNPHGHPTFPFPDGVDGLPDDVVDDWPGIVSYEGVKARSTPVDDAMAWATYCVRRLRRCKTKREKPPLLRASHDDLVGILQLSMSRFPTMAFFGKWKRPKVIAAPTAARKPQKRRPALTKGAAAAQQSDKVGLPLPLDEGVWPDPNDNQTSYFALDDEQLEIKRRMRIWLGSPEGWALFRSFSRFKQAVLLSQATALGVSIRQCEI